MTLSSGTLNTTNNISGRSGNGRDEPNGSGLETTPATSGRIIRNLRPQLVTGISRDAVVGPFALPARCYVGRA